MRLQPLLFPGIHAQLVNSIQSYTGKLLPLAHEEFLLSLECFSVALLFYWLAALTGCIDEREDILKQNCQDKVSMERPSFSIGLPRRETKQQKKERLRKKREEKRKEKLKKERRLQGYQPIPQRPPWLLLPYDVTKGLELWIVTLKGDTFLQKRKTLLEQIKHAKEPIVPVNGFDPSFGEAQKTYFLEKAKEVMRLLVENQRIRWIFKRWFTQFRVKRFAPLNSCDPITLEPIVESAWFPSFTQRKIYAFEAKPFSKYLHNALVHNEGHIPDTLSPKNPLTNEVFTLNQLMSLIGQSRKYGHSSWAIEAFIASRYDITSFMTINTKPLRLHALRTTMAKVDDWDSIDTLYDFIKSQHAAHDIPFCMSLYKWAVAHATKEARIESWRKMCLKWYEVHILIDDENTRDTYLDAIKGKTRGLCSRPEELTALRKKK